MDRAAPMEFFVHSGSLWAWVWIIWCIGDGFGFELPADGGKRGPGNGRTAGGLTRYKNSLVGTGLARCPISDWAGRPGARCVVAPC